MKAFQVLNARGKVNLSVWLMYLPRLPPVNFPEGLSLFPAYFTVVVLAQFPCTASLTSQNNSHSKALSIVPLYNDQGFVYTEQR